MIIIYTTKYNNKIKTKLKMESTKEQEIEEEYLSSLTDLNVNSKPLINMLTMLAEENIEHAPVIVKAVEKHLAKVFTQTYLDF